MPMRSRLPLRGFGQVTLWSFPLPPPTRGYWIGKRGVGAFGTKKIGMKNEEDAYER
jgi:hypothetical protein